MRHIIYTFSTVFIFLLASVSLRAQGTWTWMGGDSTINGPGNFGTQGVAAPSNQPPALYEATSFTDLQGNFWILGGIDSNFQEHAALWKYDPATLLWTWMKGPSTPAAAGIYGTQGVSSPANFPGARAWGVLSWTDQQGNLWIFGGYGYDANGVLGALGDLWKYDIATNEWTWVSGSNLVEFPGNYDSYQQPSPTALPPARYETRAAWTDNGGDLWLYGGGTQQGEYNDLWSYSVTTNTWTWVHGSNVQGASPVYGTLGISSPANTPGAMYAYGHWKDAAGNLWLFGGHGATGDNTAMWKFDVTINEWTWVSGTSVTESPGTFQQPCVAGTDYPASRTENTACWTDGCGRFWQFGGFRAAGASWDDLWVYDPVALQFTWVAGSLTQNGAGNFGTQQVAAASNYPPSCGGSAPFTDLQGNFWMFGGWSYSSAGSHMNGLWKYTPATSCPATSSPVAAAISWDSTRCAQQPVMFSAGTFIPGFTYQWNFGDPSTAGDTSGLLNPSYAYSDTGTYLVTLIVTGNTACYTGSDTATILVSITSPSAPVVTFSSPVQMVCENDQPFLLTGGTPAGGSYWSPGIYVIGGATFYPGAGSSLVPVTYTYTDSLGCSAWATDTITVDRCLGLSETDSGTALHVYPIPATNTLYIVYENEGDNDVELTLYNAGGQLVYRGKARAAIIREALPLADLAEGMYLLRIEDGKKQLSKKVVIVRE